MIGWIQAFFAAALAAGAPGAPPAAPGGRAPASGELLDTVKSLGMYAGAPRVVRDADGLAAAVGSNRTVLLEPGTYDVTGRGAISGVENLTLAAARPGTVRIVSRDAYGDVLVVSGSSNVSLLNLVVGHENAPACTGGALVVRESRHVRVRGTRLFGSGAVGVAAIRVEDLRLEQVEIDGCYGHIATLTDSRVVFEEGDLHDNEATLQIRSGLVVIEGTRIRDNRSWNDGPLLAVDAISDGLHPSATVPAGSAPGQVTLKGAVLRGNRYPALVRGGGRLDLATAVLEGNVFEGPHRWVVASVANLRGAPDPAAALVRRLPIATRVVVLQERDGWARIVADETDGFLPASLLVAAPPTVAGMIEALDRARTPAERRTWAERAAALAPRSLPVLEKLAAALDEAGDAAAAAKVRAGAAQLGAAEVQTPGGGDALVGRELLPCGVGAPVTLRAAPGGPGKGEIEACERAYFGLDGTNLRRFSVRARAEGWIELAAAGGGKDEESEGWLPVAELRGAWALTDGELELPLALHRPRIERRLKDRVVLRGERTVCEWQEVTEEVALPAGMRADRVKVIRRVAYDPDEDCRT
ncbi:MAG TPA: hypothetical protein VFL83_13045 [Anaeromyxobacter sp.]|nr:hypothetical protein [Anaeromyxobacter sp.]